MRRSKEADISVPLPYIIDWPLVDEMGMGVAIKILEKSLANGGNGRNYLQFNTVRKLRSVDSDIYSATYYAHSSRYPLKSHRKSVFHLYEGAM